MFVFRKIIEVAEETIVIEFPKELIGKRIEIIAFEIKKDDPIIDSENTFEKE